MKTALKLGALIAAGAAGVALAKKYNLVERGTALANEGATLASEKAEVAVTKVVGLVDDLLTRFEEAMNAAEDPTVEDPDVTAAASGGYSRDAAGSTPMGYGDVR